MELLHLLEKPLIKITWKILPLNARFAIQKIRGLSASLGLQHVRPYTNAISARSPSITLNVTKNVPLRKTGIMKFFYKKICFDINPFEIPIERRINITSSYTTGNQSRKISEITFSTYIF